MRSCAVAGKQGAARGRQSPSYYYANGQRIAVRRSGYGSDNNLFWLLTDHLGSTAVTLWPGGAKKAELRYKAFGETRYTLNSTPTTYRYTGQREESAIGLCFYRGRWYDVVLGRFVQADTIVPDPADPQDLNRYAYVRNSPLNYTDPSGHAICVDEECSLVFHPVSGDIIRRGPGASYWNQSGMGLFWDWYAEQGPETRYYGRNASMTQDLMNDEGMQEARETFYRNGGYLSPYGHRYPFSQPRQPIREAVQWLSGEDSTGVGSVLGGYTVFMDDNNDGTVSIWVYNITSRESGSRLLGHGPILETAPAEYWNQLLSALAEVLSGTASPGSLREVWPVSVFEDRTRGQTGPLPLPWVGPNGWGGNVTQWYMWTEPLCIDCMR